MKGVASLIGEQPIPILLPLRYLSPKEAVFIYTDRTEYVANRLRNLVKGQMNVYDIKVLPYDINSIRNAIQEWMSRHRQSASDWIFNLTGGTKLMSIAAYEIAARHRAPFVYLESETKQPVLYRYDFKGNEYQITESQELRPLICIEDYLKVHVDEYNQQPRGQDIGFQFERVVADALRGAVDEVMEGVTLKSVGSTVELDVVVRIGNQVGVIQAKTGKRARSKDGLLELKSACSREFLGIYTKKILVINQEWDHTQQNLQELADYWGIHVIKLLSFKTDSPSLSPEDQEKLREQVRKVLIKS